MARATFRESDILDQLDRHARTYDFPTLDNGYIYPIDARLTAYRDDGRWAIVIEHVGYMYRSLQFGNILYAFGSGLLVEPGHGAIIDLVPGDRWMTDTGMHVRPGLRSIQIHGRRIALKPSDLAPPSTPEGEAMRDLPIPEFFRRLLPRCRNLYHATEGELREVVPADLPQVLRLLEWEHSDAVQDRLPSQTECFPMIAKVLASGNANQYKPTKPPNTHWSNWPEGGAL